MGIFQSTRESKEEKEKREENWKQCVKDDEDIKSRIEILQWDYFLIDSMLKQTKNPEKIKEIATISYYYSPWSCVRELLEKYHWDEISFNIDEIKTYRKNTGFSATRFDVTPGHVYFYTLSARCEDCILQGSKECYKKENNTKQYKTHIICMHGLHFRSVSSYMEWFACV